MLERAGKLDKLREVRQVAEMVNIMSVRQKKQLGLGHAVLCARELVRDDPFAIMVGDDLMFGGVPGIGQLIEVAMAEKMPVIGVMEVPWEKVSRYGIIDGEEVAPGVFPGCATWWKNPSARPRLRGWRLWPLCAHAGDFRLSGKGAAGHGGEIQLTDALQAMAQDRGMMAVRMSGMRFDAGDWAEFLTANIYFALQDGDCVTNCWDCSRISSSSSRNSPWDLSPKTFFSLLRQEPLRPRSVPETYCPGLQWAPFLPENKNLHAQCFPKFIF